FYQTRWTTVSLETQRHVFEASVCVCVASVCVARVCVCVCVCVVVCVLRGVVLRVVCLHVVVYEAVIILACGCAHGQLWTPRMRSCCFYTFHFKSAVQQL